MLLADNRIELDARPAPPKPPLLEVAMLGHCPSRDGAARWQRLASDATLLGEIASLGFGRRVAFLKAMDRDPDLVASLADHARLAGLLAKPDSQANEAAILAVLRSLDLNERLLRLYLPEALTDPADQARYLVALGAEAVSLASRVRAVLDHRALYRLPIPVYTFGQFQALFPESFDVPCAYQSTLAGGKAWLPVAVQDFFDGDSTATQGSKKLWVLRVPEREAQAAFLPNPAADLIHIESLGAFDCALLIPRIGILALPDLERLQVPPDLPDIPRLRLANPTPMFRPGCGIQDDTHRERRYGSEIPLPPALLKPEDLIPPIIRSLARFRPDLMCLLSLPLEGQLQGERPVPAADFLRLVGQIAGTASAEAHGELGDKLRHIQFLYPYLRGPGVPLCTPCGVVAGMQAQVSHLQGPWRSVAERTLPGLKLPYPVISQQEATTLRNGPGVSVLVHRGAAAVLDDERLAVPCLPGIALRQLDPVSRTFEHWRSAEVMRFMGWIRRELQRLGDQLVFNIDPPDPRPEMALRQFFTRLHTQGALRGARPEQAFRITSHPEGESTISFDIEIAPAYPLDLIRITFAHDRHAGGVETSIEAAHG